MTEIAALILIIIASIICCMILCILFREFHFEKEYIVRKPPNSILIHTYCAIILFLSSMISSIINIVINPSFSSDIINDTVTIIAWSIAQLFVFSLLITRIHYLLSFTKYQLKEYNYIIFGILIFVCCLLCIVWILRSILYYNQYKNGHISQKGIKEFTVFFVITVEIIDLIISIFFIAIFVNKLKIITKHSQTNHTQNHQILQVKMTKYWVLSLTVIISTQSIAAILCLLSITEYIGDNIASKVFAAIYEILRPLITILICICLFLLFQTYQETYHRRCKICDNMAMNCFGKITEKKKKYKLDNNALNQSLLKLENNVNDNQL